ncbi:MAG: aminotransferase class IV [Eubacteriales bacterium]
MKTLGYYNGKFDEIENMSVPMNDRACYFGDGVYDATYAGNYTIYCLDAHINRFYNSAALMGMTVPCDKGELKTLLCNLVKKLDCGDQFVYWQITRGSAIRNHAYPDCPANLWVMLRPVPIRDTYQTMDLITVEDTRFFHCNVKTLNLLPNVLAAEKVKIAGCEEAIFHRGDVVTECSHSNIHILKDGALKTHPTDCHILPGIARANLIACAKELGIPVDETPFTVAELFTADEVIVSSSGTFCIPAAHIDTKKVGGKAPVLLKKIQDYLQADWVKHTI